MNAQELKIVAVVQFNQGEAIVMNRPINLLYEKVGNDYIGADGPFRDFLQFSSARGAFAGREMSLTMKDGSEVKVRENWWSAHLDGSMGIGAACEDQLKRCYVFSGLKIVVEAYRPLRNAYTGCVYPYRDYEKVLKYDDERTDMWNKVFQLERKTANLVAQVKQMARARDAHAAAIQSLRDFVAITEGFGAVKAAAVQALAKFEPATEKEGG